MGEIEVAKSKNKRGCYCGAFDQAYLEENNIPEGYCGICSCCEKPGHLRHAPGCAPYTDAWCDSCFKSVWFRNNLQCLSLLATPTALFFGHWYLGAVAFLVFAATTYAIKKSRVRKSASQATPFK